MFAALKGHTNDTYANVWKETFSLKAFELALPALCFAFQNVLYFTSLSHIDAATYSILSQSKTAFTAFFFVTLLGRTLNAVQVCKH
jgi:drug/metabolite transporter (DMT)-like permease